MPPFSRNILLASRHTTASILLAQSYTRRNFTTTSSSLRNLFSASRVKDSHISRNSHPITKLGLYINSITPSHLVGIALFRQQLGSRQLLVLKRSASDAQFPGKWCLPGGHILCFESVGDAIVREMHEETGLEVGAVVKEFEGVEWRIDLEGDKAADHDLDLSRRDRYLREVVRTRTRWNFIVTVKEIKEVRLNPTEHDCWMWVSEKDLGALECSEGMRGVLRNAFKSLE